MKFSWIALTFAFSVFSYGLDVTDYIYESEIVIENVSSNFSGIVCSLKLDLWSSPTSAELYQKSFSKKPGDDFAVLLNGVPIDRDVIKFGYDEIDIRFRLETVGSSLDENRYQLIYGSPAELNPKDNCDNIYDFWDNFDGPALDSTKWSAGDAKLAVSGELIVSTATAHTISSLQGFPSNSVVEWSGTLPANAVAGTFKFELSPVSSFTPNYFRFGSYYFGSVVMGDLHFYKSSPLVTGASSDGSFRSTVFNIDLKKRTYKFFRNPANKEITVIRDGVSETFVWNSAFQYMRFAVDNGAMLKIDYVRVSKWNPGENQPKCSLGKEIKRDRTELYPEANSTGKYIKVSPSVVSLGSGIFPEIQLDLENNIECSIQILSLNGHIIEELLEKEKRKGLITMTWDLKTRSGETVSPGTYILSIQYGTKLAMEVLNVCR